VRRSERPLEGLLEPAAIGDQGRVPLPPVVDLREPPVRELVADVEGEVEIVVTESIPEEGRWLREPVRG
jgi:hypothetical protein